MVLAADMEPDKYQGNSYSACTSNIQKIVREEVKAGQIIKVDWSTESETLNWEIKDQI